eukprot:GDKI01021368.1.p1 GENE.GDKI01021368.1~~GDKI01021368.1.p1  ORF type:complete len:320 (+),score=103.27 GDKI01021368.1:100-1059(+)
MSFSKPTSSGCTWMSGVCPLAAAAAAGASAVLAYKLYQRLTRIPKFVEVEPGYVRCDSAHPSAQLVASRLPGFNFKKVPAFFDVGGLTADAQAMQLVTDIFVARYKRAVAEKRLTKIVGFDARGFLFGTPLAMALGIPFVMLRKKGKLPGPVCEIKYGTEYSEDNLTCPVNAVREGDRVVLIDDLLATGGTLQAGAQLVYALGAEVHECALIVAIEGLKGWKKFHATKLIAPGCENKSLQNVPVFTIADGAITPSMPAGSLESYCIDMNSAELPQVRKVMRDAHERAVLVRTEVGGVVRYAAGVPGADGKYNQSYAEEK